MPRQKNEMDLDVETCLVVSNTDICVGCSSKTVSKSKYYIVKPDGQKGAAYKRCTLFYKCPFSSATNYGAHVCRTCYRTIERTIKMFKKANELYSMIMRTSQKFNQKMSLKRPSSPNSDQSKRMKTTDTRTDVPDSNPVTISATEQTKRQNHINTDLDQDNGDESNHIEASDVEDTDLDEESGISSTTLTKQTDKQDCNQDNQTKDVEHGKTVMKDLQPYQADICDVSRQTKDCGIHVQTKRSYEVSTQTKDRHDASVQTVDKSILVLSRKEPAENIRTKFIIFRSTQLKESLGSSVTHLSNGNVKSAIKSLLQHDQDVIRQKAYDGLRAVVKDECDAYTKKQDTHIRSTITDLESFNFENLTNEIKNESPVLWLVLTSASTSKISGIQEIRTTTAATILYSSHCVNLNSLQYSLAITLHNYHLKKKGYAILSRLGITSSYSTVKKYLRKNKGNVEKQLIPVETGQENDYHLQIGYENDHPYSKIK